MSKIKTPRKPKPLYRQKTPKIEGDDFVHAEPISPAHFALREDGSIEPAPFGVHASACPAQSETDDGDTLKRGHQTAPRLTFSSDSPFIRLYHGNSLELLDAIAAKYPDDRFDAIFADPPYFLSNGGISCHAGRMVKVDT